MSGFSWYESGVIERGDQLDKIQRLIRQFPVVAVIGARQVGKSTLARAFAERSATASTFFDLEDPRTLARLDEPMMALEPLRGLVVLDEIQRRPDIFPVLRVLADRPRRPARFLVLGSASPELLRQSSETLSGRIAYHELAGFQLSEVGIKNESRLWLRGGYPPSFTARSDDESLRWRAALTRTFLERDLPALGFRLSPQIMQRFWSMLAHYHAQIWNGAELARAFGVTEKTVVHYLDVLVSTFMALRLSPWHENLSKRQVKAPKVYLTDSGVLHSLLAIQTREELMGHPKVGASWEGFAIHEIVQRLELGAHERFFWAVHSGAELDLLAVRGQKRLGFEIKLTDSPRVTPSMRSALENLKLDRIDVIHAGAETYQLSDRIRALPLRAIWADTTLARWLTRRA